MELKNTEYEVDTQGVAMIWLNRPQRMNAWTGRLHTEYRYLLKRANDDDAVRAIVVTGRGKGFCVGGDSQALSGHADRGATIRASVPTSLNPATVPTRILMPPLPITSA